METKRIDWKGQIIPRVKELVESYSYRPTLRQVFYRLVAGLLIPNTEVTYKGLSRATVLARENGELNPLCFDDRVRSSSGGDYGYTDPEAFIQYQKEALRTCQHYYTRYLWESQTEMPIIWLEKDALFTPVSSVAEKYRVKVYAARGYSSFTAVYQAAQEITGYQALKVLQLTDFDPSGEDMVRDLETRLRRYGATDFEVEKIALTYDQVRKHGLPPMPAKTTDPRYTRFEESYGEDCVELDALPPDELERIVTAAITDLIDSDAWNRELSQARTEREKIAEKIAELTEDWD